MSSYRGSAVVDGKLQYTSPTQISLADDSQDGGCARKWYYRYVLKDKPPEKAYQKRGTAVHEEIEHYYKTGERRFSAQTTRLTAYLPPRENVLGVELELQGHTLAGIEVVAKIDLVTQETDDIGGTLEILDWKTCNDFRFAERPGDLIHTVPMPIYADYVFERFGAWSDTGVLSHVYSQSKSPWEVRKVSEPVTRPLIKKRVDAIEETVERLKSWAGETEIEKVPGNAKACASYGGCPYRAKCNAVPIEEQLFGLHATPNSVSVSLHDLLTETKKHMDLLDQLKTEKDQLKAEASNVAPLDPFADAYHALKKLGHGIPRLTGAAAARLAKMLNHDVSEFAGTGQLAALVVSDPADLPKVLSDVSGTVAIVPPDAPDPRELRESPQTAETEEPKKKRGRPKAQTEDSAPAVETKVLRPGARGRLKGDPQQQEFTIGAQSTSDPNLYFVHYWSNGSLASALIHADAIEVL